MKTKPRHNLAMQAPLTPDYGSSAEFVSRQQLDSLLKSHERRIIGQARKLQEWARYTTALHAELQELRKRLLFTENVPKMMAGPAR